MVTSEIRAQKYKELKLDAEQMLAYDGYRRLTLENPKEEDDREGLIARLAYKARPLNGVWATAPYLHNGSVPNLYEMLVPAANRTGRFYVGSREFDKDRVGIITSRSSSGFELDTSLAGNRNTGHEFRNLTLEELESYVRPGQSGLSRRPEADRWAVVLHLSPAEYAGLTSEQRWEKEQLATDVALHRGLHVKGVLGSELRDDERFALVEYLKSL